MAKKKEKVVYNYIEEFSKADQAHYENSQIQNMLEEILEANKDNVALQEYVSLLKKFEENQELYDNCKKNMYESMNEADVDYLEGLSIVATLKKPYTKKELDVEKLTEDLGEEKLKTYYKEKAVKGNVTFKPREEE